jgi:hypothetical protein
MRFSLRALLLAVPIVALATSGFVFNIEWATSLIYTICMSALVLAVVGAAFARGERRLFWAGFAAMGWGYWWLAFETTSSSRNSVNPPSGMVWGGAAYFPNYSARSPIKEYRFVTSDLLDFLDQYSTLHKRPGTRVMAPWGGSTLYPAVILEVAEESCLVKWDDGAPPTWVSLKQVQPYSGAVSRVAGHSLFCLVFSVVGGALVALLFRESARQSPQELSSVRQ